MENIETYSRIITSLLGIAYPLILQAIVRLDTAYNSTLIIELFEKEPRKKWFEIQLFASLIILVIWSFEWEPLEQFENLGYIIDNSAAILMILTSILLVLSFLMLVKRIYTYYVPSKFVVYLIHKHEVKR